MWQIPGFWLGRPGRDWAAGKAAWPSKRRRLDGYLASLPGRPGKLDAVWPSSLGRPGREAGQPGKLDVYEFSMVGKWEGVVENHECL